MASKILPYYIGLTDKDRVAELQQERHLRADGKLNTQPGLVFMAPTGNDWSAEAPISGWAEVEEGPATWSPFFEPAAGGSAGAFPMGVATFTRKAGGFWGWLGFGSTKFYWAGQFRYIPSSDALPGDEEEDPLDGDGDPIPPAKLPIQQRRWIDGFEAIDFGATGSGTLPAGYASVDSSRHLGGFGLGLRNINNVQFTKTCNIYGLAASASDWERIYIRVRKRPDAGSGQFWQFNFDQGSAPAVQLELLPTGQIAIYVQTSVGTRALIGTTTTPLTVNRWYRFDALVVAPPLGGAAGTDGSFTLYIGQRQAFTGAVSKMIINNGISTAVHVSSVLGSSTATNNMEVDLDDWVCIAGAPSKATLDWRHGSKIVPVRATAFGSGHDAAGWPGAIQVVAQRPVVSSGADQFLTSTTALARFEVDTDSDVSADSQPGSIGIASLIVSKFGTRGTTSGQIGYKLGAAAEVLTAVTEAVVAGWVSALYTISGVTDPTAPAGPIKLSHIKGNDASAGTVYTLLAQAECIGQFDIADNEDADSQDDIGNHNWPYPRSPWAIPGAQMPLSPVVIYHGAYAGNGTGVGIGGQDIEFPTPIHWWWCRPLTGSPSGSHWWSTMSGAHSGHDEGTKPAALSMAFVDADFVPGATEDSQQTQSVVRLGGDNAQVNDSGVNYQYIAVSDPGGRFMLNGTIAHRHTVTETNELVNQNFLALAAWFFGETYGGGGGSNDHFFKGPGNTAAGMSPLTAAETASAVTIALGDLTTQTAFHGAYAQVAYSLWRQDDGSDDPGRVDVCSVTSYIGDGNASRTIGFSPASTKSPLFAYVQSRTAPGGGIYRDPSHTGTTSTTAAGAANAATGITAGDVASITVGSALNAAGQVYSVFVIWGASNPGGWTPAPVIDDPPIVIIPVEPDEPIDGPVPGTPPPDEDPGIDPDPEDPDPFAAPPGLEDDLEDGLCSESTIATMNLALSRVGSSQHVVDPLTDASLDAHLVAEHWGEAVMQTLRDFPWPFATKYATLTLVGGTAAVAVNGDWQYSYRKPGDCVFERRIVVPRVGAVDPEPPPMGFTHDVTGGLILTNEVAAKLEYTARPACIAAQGDALFRDALAWKLASMIAGPLTRMKETIDATATSYAQAIANAERVLKPGVPGARPAAPVVDVADACQTANIEVANLALIRIGAQTITNLTTDQSREATAVRMIFERELRSTLRDFPWPFARAYADAPVLVGGTEEDPVNADWTYSFRLPADYVRMRRQVTTLGMSFEPDPYPYAVGRDTTGWLLFTDQEEPIIEYTARRECAVSQADPLFQDALAWRLAASLAPSLAQKDPEEDEQVGRGPEPLTKPARPNVVQAGSVRDRAMRYAWAQYHWALTQAKIAALNERQVDPNQGDAPWILDRNR